MDQKLPSSGRILGVDLGDANIGLATAGVIAKIPDPIQPVKNDENLVINLKNIINSEDIQLLVIGLPRNLRGEETEQSSKIRETANMLSERLGLKIEFVDESLSSVRADEYLKSNKNNNISQDSLAACFILEEFFRGVK